VDYLLVFVGGGIGSMTRLAVGTFVSRVWGSAWPAGTLFINVSGSFAIGLFLTLAAQKWGLSPAYRYFVATGFLGGYTTFSTFEYETQRLVEAGAAGSAALYVASSVILGFGGALAGVALARKV
jgi:fluoride exporter